MKNQTCRTCIFFVEGYCQEHKAAPPANYIDENSCKEWFETEPIDEICERLRAQVDQTEWARVEVLRDMMDVQTIGPGWAVCVASLQWLERCTKIDHYTRAAVWSALIPYGLLPF